MITPAAERAWLSMTVTSAVTPRWGRLRLALLSFKKKNVDTVRPVSHVRHSPGRLYYKTETIIDLQVACPQCSRKVAASSESFREAVPRLSNQLDILKTGSGLRWDKSSAGVKLFNLLPFTQTVHHSKSLWGAAIEGNSSVSCRISKSTSQKEWSWEAGRVILCRRCVWGPGIVVVSALIID